MTVLLYTETNHLIEHMADVFIPRGISLYHLDSLEQLPFQLRECSPDIVLVDVNKENHEAAYKVLRALSLPLESSTLPAVPVIYARGVSEETIALGIKAGGRSFIRGDATDNDLVQGLKRICEKAQGRPPLLQFTRIILDPTNPNENVVVRFISPRSEHSVMGIVHDMSAGGLVMRLTGNFASSDIELGLHIPNTHFILLSHEIVLTAVVRAFKEDLCALRFVDVSSQDMHEIAQYIYMKLAKLI